MVLGATKCLHYPAVLLILSYIRIESRTNYKLLLNYQSIIKSQPNIYKSLKDGPILWAVGLIMAICNLAGAQIGTHLALKHGAGFIRKAFLGVVAILIFKQLSELF